MSGYSVLEQLGEKRYEIQFNEREHRKAFLSQLRKPLADHLGLVKKLVSPPNPLLHLPIYDSSHDLLNITSEAVNDICGRSESSEEAEDVLWRQQALYDALEYIRINGDSCLKGMLSPEEWSRVENYVPQCERWDASGELTSFIESANGDFDDLVFHDEEETRTQWVYLPLRGKAVHSFFLHKSNTDQRRYQLNRKISECYRLPDPTEYEFLVWKYVYPLQSHIIMRPDVWEIYKIPLMEIMRPIVPQSGFSSIATEKYESIRPRMIQGGITEENLRELELKYANIVSDDTMRRSIRALDFAVPIVASMLKNDNRPLYESLRSSAKRLIKELVEAQFDDVILFAARKRVTATISKDAMLYAVFFDLIYDWMTLLRESYRRFSPGKKRVVPEKNLTDRISCEFVALIQSANIKYPWDFGAEVLNALAGVEIYSEFKSEGFDTQTSGGAVLRNDCIRARQGSGQVNS